MASTVSKQDARITAPLSVSTTQQAVSNPATPRQYPMGSNDQTSNSDSSRSSAHGNSNHASTKYSFIDMIIDLFVARRKTSKQRIAPNLLKAHRKHQEHQQLAQRLALMF
jgi:hypothetical protein